MTKEELEKEAEENSFRFTLDKPWACEVERKQIMAHFEKGYLAGAESREKHIAELEAQIEKLIDFVLSKTDCCDVCPITDTCINSEGTCPYAGILAKSEEVTRKWLLQYISRR